MGFFIAYTFTNWNNYVHSIYFVVHIWLLLSSTISFTYLLMLPLTPMLVGEIESKQGRGRERERETENPKQALQLWAQSQMWGSNSNCEIMTWIRVKSWMLNRLSHQGVPIQLFFFKKSFLMFIYYWETERDRARAWEGQREEETQNLKQAPDSELLEPDAGLKLTNWEIMTWAEVGCSSNWATQTPLNNYS